MCAEFRVRYVGAIEKLEFNMSKTLQEPLDLIGYIDAAQVGTRSESTVSRRKRCCKICFVSQQAGKLPFVPGDREMILGVSKYGVKVASLDQCVSGTALYCTPIALGRYLAAFDLTGQNETVVTRTCCIDTLCT